MKVAVVISSCLLTACVVAQDAVQLPEMVVHSPRVANQSPVATFAMPVSALRFEPRVDIQGRNLAEGQADVTLRGGIFENTAFQLGALTVSDPQTGHYFAELPVSPFLLQSPEVRTGTDLGLGAANATVGAIQSRWRPIRTAGVFSAGLGDHALRRADFHQGYVTGPERGGRRLGLDVAISRSKSDGSRPWGEHDFNRANVRLQTATDQSQTDLVAAYQGKRFGWPNLYTPFNSNETENLQTALFALNHRVDGPRGDFVEAGAYHRRNKDDYAFNRFAPVGPVHPFQHTTWVSGAAAGGRQTWGDLALNARAEVSADELKSTSLTFGRYRTRTLTKLAVAPERSWVAADGTVTRLKAGASYDDSNRSSGALSPLAEVAREYSSGVLRRIFLSYVRTTQLPTYTALNSSATGGLFRGNPDLGRERSDAVELGVSGTGWGWSGQAALFARRDDALVDWTYRRGVTARTANAVDVTTTGFEAVARRSWSQVDLVLGYTVLAKDADYRGAAVDGSFYALNYARHRLTAAVTVRLGGGFEVRVDNVARVQADNSLRTIGGDETLATALGLSYRPASWRGVEVVVQADNLWNSSFQDVPAVPAARRQLSAGVGYAW